MAAPTPLRRLFPDPGPVHAEEVTRGLALGGLAPPGRPYVVVNFVESADGRATVGGRSGGLGGDADRAIFHGLRTQVDAILVGTGTLRTERYGRLVPSPERREVRVREGLAADPLALIVTRSGDVPTDIPLFGEPTATIVVCTGTGLAAPDCAADVRVLSFPHAELSFAAVLARVHRELGVRSVLCEGGPRVFGALLREGVADELFLSLAAKLAGGEDAPSILEGVTLDPPAELELLHLLAAGSDLFLRYRIRR